MAQGRSGERDDLLLSPSHASHDGEEREGTQVREPRQHQQTARGHLCGAHEVIRDSHYSSGEYSVVVR